MTMEIKDTGRVRLRDFYESAMGDNTSTFLESVDYLSQLGTLEDMDPSEPRVVISNYIGGPSNCVVRTGYYSLCCMDECADLYSHLELSLKKPAAALAEIVPIIEGLASASMTQCRKLSTSQLERLKKVADRNAEGLVELHGPDFADWMHSVYPRECAKSSQGPAQFLTVEEWQEETHLSAQANLDEMKAIVEQLKLLELTREPFSSQVEEPSAHDLADIDYDSEEDLQSGIGVIETITSFPISFETLAKVALLGFAVALLPKVSTKLSSNHANTPSRTWQLADGKMSDWPYV